MESSVGKVSVIVPVYNAGKYLNRCIASLLAQTYTDLEILLIDDGSTDDSLALCNAYARKDSRIVVLHHENHGVSYTRNRGLKVATGDYIIFVDADDWVALDYVQKLRTPLDSHDVEISMCGYGMSYDDGRFVNMMHFTDGVIPKEVALDLFSPYYLGAVCSKMYSRSALQNKDGFRILFDEDIAIGEDQLFWIRAVLNVGSVYVSSDPLYHYYMNDSGAMRGRNFAGYYTDFLARQRMGALLSEYPKLVEANTMFCTAAAAQAMAVADLPINDKRMTELSNYVKANFSPFIKHPQVCKKEKLRVLLVSSEFTRKLARLLLKYKQRQTK